MFIRCLLVHHRLIVHVKLIYFFPFLYCFSLRLTTNKRLKMTFNWPTQQNNFRHDSLIVNNVYRLVDIDRKRRHFPNKRTFNISSNRFRHHLPIYWIFYRTFYTNRLHLYRNRLRLNVNFLTIEPYVCMRMCAQSTTVKKKFLVAFFSFSFYSFSAVLFRSLKSK